MTPGGPGELDGSADALALADAWPAAHVSCVLVGPDGVLATRGDQQRQYALASVTKVLTSLAVLVAVEEGSVDLEAPLGPPGSTARHLLAHASGLGPDGEVISPPGHRRIYSNAGFDLLGRHLRERTGFDTGTYLAEAVADPLGLGATRLEGSPASGVSSNAADLARVARELLRPGRLVDRSTLATATVVAFPGLDGVLPGFGLQQPNDWGLGFEIRGHKSPHWTAPGNDPRTFGHFGRSGTFVWVDPVADLALVVLTDEPFGPWAAEAWPLISEAALSR